MDTTTRDRYLERIEATGRPLRPDLETLTFLQEQHLRTVPFETFGFTMREPVEVGDAALRKIIDQRRGGGCYELNSAFADLLRAIGFECVLLGSSTYTPDGELGALYGHMVIRVDLEEQWIVDVGYRFGGRHPLRYASREEQQDPDGVFEFRDAGRGDIDFVRNGRKLHRFEARPRVIEDFLPTLWWFRSGPGSPVLDRAWAALLIDDARVTMNGRELTRIVDGKRVTKVLTDDEFLPYCEEAFGIRLSRLPKLPELEAAR